MVYDPRATGGRIQAQRELISRLRLALSAANAEIRRLGGHEVHAELNGGMATPRGLRHRHVALESREQPLPHHCACGKAVFDRLPGRPNPTWFHPRPGRTIAPPKQT